MVDYTKWDHIEVSDDEDETHPNIDTPSLFKWRHEARMQKMETMQGKKDNLQKKIDENKSKLKTAEEKITKAKKENKDIEELEKSLKSLKAEDTKLRDEQRYLLKEEKALPLNVDTLSQPGFSKTIINKPNQKEEELTEEQKHENSKAFMDKHKEEIKKYGMLHEYHDSEAYLVKHPHLSCEDTANYLVVWCIDLEVEEKKSLMKRVAHQTICMQFLLELAKSLEIDPRAAVAGFFQKMKKGDAQYNKGFQDELDSFIGRVRERAQARIDKAMKEYEEEERQKRLGPGGLDPVEVFESLPKSLQDCFESKDIELLKTTMSALPQEEAQYHLQRCVESGLWIPDANKAAEEAAAESKNGDAEPEEQ